MGGRSRGVATGAPEHDRCDWTPRRPIAPEGLYLASRERSLLQCVLARRRHAPGDGLCGEEGGDLLDACEGTVRRGDDDDATPTQLEGEEELGRGGEKTPPATARARTRARARANVL